MLFAFITGWAIGSLSLYSYLVITAKEPPYPECMECNSTSCNGCTVMMEDKQEYRRVA